MMMKENVYKIYSGDLNSKGQLDLSYMGRIHQFMLSRNSVQWLALINTVLKHRFQELDAVKAYIISVFVDG
jgi:hypothetical protein